MAKQHLFLGFLSALTFLSACSSGPRDAQTLIADSKAAMGSNELHTIVYKGDGFETCVGQQYDPYVDWRKFQLNDVTRSLDLDKMAWRNQDTRVDELQRGGCGAGPVATRTRNDVVQLTDDSNWGQKMDFIMLPQGFLQWASTHGSTVITDEDGSEMLVVDGGDNPDVTAHFDDNDYLVSIDTTTSENFLGTIKWSAEFTDWKDVGNGVMFPGKIVEMQGGRPIYEMDVASAEPNAEVDVMLPERAKGKGFPRGKGKGKGKGGEEEIVEHLADGVDLIKGGYASLLLDMGDHLVVAGAGNSDERVEQVLAEAKRLYPDKEITQVINTHHHHDHATGLRGWAAKGVTILTHEVNADYLREWLANENTLHPGLLEEAGMPEAKIETFGDFNEITDGKHNVQMHRVQDSTHATGMVFVYVPSANVILEADEFNVPNGTPGEGEVNPYHVNLVKNIDRLGLNVRRVIPIHLPRDGHKVTMKELRAWAGM